MNSINIYADAALADGKRRSALERLFQRLGEVACLPSSAMLILQLDEQRNSRIDDLCHIIKGDPALAARVLQRVNSAFYGLRRQVADLRTAVGLLGFREIRNLAITVLMGRLFIQPGAYGNFSREKLWTHCVAVATTSRLVSLVCGRGVPDECYVGGLLHDLGLMLIDQYLRSHFYRVLRKLNERTPTSLVEQRILSFDHAQLGAYVAHQWRFPDSVGAAIGFHHRPGDYSGPHADFVSVVAIADYLCSRWGYTSLGVQNNAAPSDSVYKQLNLDETNLKIIWDEMEGSLEGIAGMACA